MCSCSIEPRCIIAFFRNVIIIINIVIHMHIRINGHYSGGEVTRQRQESRANNEVQKLPHLGSSPTSHVPTSHTHRQRNTKHSFFYTFTVDTRTPHAAAAHRHLNPVFSPFVFLYILPGPLSLQPLLPSFVH